MGNRFTLLRNVTKMLNEESELQDVVVSRKGLSQSTVSTQAEGQKVILTWRNVSYKVKVGKDMKNILENVSGCVHPGEITAIMGPSGAGKTTLLNILSGFHTRNYTGEMYMNGCDYSATIFKKLSTYVMHGDHLLPYLTVLETMNVAASLKLKHKLSSEQKTELFEKILSEWGLKECANVLTKRLSNGQKKRLIVAQELVNNAPVVFLDEPTSGLDSSTSFHCIQLLKALSRKGHTVICTIHQPSSNLFHQFDKVYMLAEGLCIYRGTVENVGPHLAKNDLVCPSYYNPADFLTEIAQGDHGEWNRRLADFLIRGRVADDLSDLPEEAKRTSKDEQLENGHESADVPLLIKSEIHLQDWRVNYLTQVSVLLRRCFISFYRDPMLFHLRFITYIIVGLMLGTIYYDIGDKANKIFNNSSLLFFSLLFLLFSGMMPTLLIFPLEAYVFSREFMNNWYTVKAYITAKTLSDVPFQIFFPVLFTSIVYWMTSQPPELTRFLLFLLISVQVSFVAQSVGMLFGACFNTQVAVFAGPAFSIPILFFSGFVATLDTITSYLRWISSVSYVRYGYEGLMLTVYGMDRDELTCENIGTNEVCFFTEGQSFLNFVSFGDSKLYMDILLLFVMDVIIKIGIYIVLRVRFVYRPFSS